MTSVYTIALDAMGGDHGLQVIAPAAIEALRQHSDIKLILVGDEEKILAELEKHGQQSNARLSIHHASQVVEMDEAPALALRNKKDSSMRVAINLVKNNTADAAVSAGNTGALMATARFVLKMLPGIDRPAICSFLPSEHHYTHILDLGANVDSSAEHLCQFAIMGAELVRAVDNIESPKVGLLNIGQEAIKGNEQVKAASTLLEQADLNYIGFVEGDDVFLKDIDLVVCDGFVGNVALKTVEGFARMISNELKSQFKRNLFTKIAAILSLPVLKAFGRKFDPRRYNGASFLGVQGIVVKSHGGADSLSYASAISIARAEAITNVPQKIKKRLEVLFENKD